MMRYANGLGTPVSRDIEAFIGKEKFVFRFPKAKIGDPDRTFRCRSSQKFGRQRGNIFVLEDTGLWGGVLLKFSRQNSPETYSSREIRMKVVNSGGWFSVDDVLTQNLERGELQGVAKYLSFSGGIESLRLDNSDVAFNKHDIFATAGKIEARYLDNGSLKFNGKADQFWRNGDRFSPTKWERTPWEARVLLFTFILSLGGILEFSRRYFEKKRHVAIGQLV